jgi:hypothetical protein
LMAETTDTHTHTHTHRERERENRETQRGRERERERESDRGARQHLAALEQRSIQGGERAEKVDRPRAPGVRPLQECLAAICLPSLSPLKR